jgi:hypothetical protein
LNVFVITALGSSKIVVFIRGVDKNIHVNRAS